MSEQLPRNSRNTVVIPRYSYEEPSFRAKNGFKEPFAKDQWIKLSESQGYPLQNESKIPNRNYKILEKRTTFKHKNQVYSSYDDTLSPKNDISRMNRAMESHMKNF